MSEPNQSNVQGDQPSIPPVNPSAPANKPTHTGTTDPQPSISSPPSTNSHPLLIPPPLQFTSLPPEEEESQAASIATKTTGNTRRVHFPLEPCTSVEIYDIVTPVGTPPHSPRTANRRMRRRRLMYGGHFIYTDCGHSTSPMRQHDAVRDFHLARYGTAEDFFFWAEMEHVKKMLTIERDDASGSNDGEEDDSGYYRLPPETFAFLQEQCRQNRPLRNNDPVDISELPSLLPSTFGESEIEHPRLDITRTEVAAILEALTTHSAPWMDDYVDRSSVRPVLSQSYSTPAFLPTSSQSYSSPAFLPTSSQSSSSAASQPMATQPSPSVSFLPMSAQSPSPAASHPMSSQSSSSAASQPMASQLRSSATAPPSTLSNTLSNPNPAMIRPRSRRMPIDYAQHLPISSTSTGAPVSASYSPSPSFSLWPQAAPTPIIRPYHPTQEEVSQMDFAAHMEYLNRMQEFRQHVANNPSTPIDDWTNNPTMPRPKTRMHASLTNGSGFGAGQKSSRPNSIPTRPSNTNSLPANTKSLPTNNTASPPPSRFTPVAYNFQPVIMTPSLPNITTTLLSAPTTPSATSQLMKTGSRSQRSQSFPHPSIGQMPNNNARKGQRSSSSAPILIPQRGNGSNEDQLMLTSSAPAVTRRLFPSFLRDSIDLAFHPKPKQPQNWPQEQSGASSTSTSSQPNAGSSTSSEKKNEMKADRSGQRAAGRDNTRIIDRFPSAPSHYPRHSPRNIQQNSSLLSQPTAFSASAQSSHTPTQLSRMTTPATTLTTGPVSSCNSTPVLSARSNMDAMTRQRHSLGISPRDGDGTNTRNASNSVGSGSANGARLVSSSTMPSSGPSRSRWLEASTQGTDNDFFLPHPAALSPILPSVLLASNGQFNNNHNYFEQRKADNGISELMYQLPEPPSVAPWETETDARARHRLREVNDGGQAYRRRVKKTDRAARERFDAQEQEQEDEIQEHQYQDDNYIGEEQYIDDELEYAEDEGEEEEARFGGDDQEQNGSGSGKKKKKKNLLQRMKKGLSLLKPKNKKAS